MLLLVCPLEADVFDRGGPRSTNNDGSCDISVLPAATLLQLGNGCSPAATA